MLGVSGSIRLHRLESESSLRLMNTLILQPLILQFLRCCRAILTAAGRIAGFFDFMWFLYELYEEQVLGYKSPLYGRRTADLCKSTVSNRRDWTLVGE